MSKNDKKKKKKKDAAKAPVEAHAHDHAGHDHDHGHDHDDHDHDHDHGHDHEHDTTPANPPLERGAGKGKILFLDAPSGLAGDMIIAALLDLGVPTDALEEAFAGLELEGFHIHLGTRTKSGIVGTAFDVHVEDDQPERTWGSIKKMLVASELAEGVKRRALMTFERLAESEARVHRMPIEEVHFHEVGGVDAIVDVVGSAACLAWLDARLVVSPLPMGHGKVKARHGILPLPPPAVVECLKGFPTYDAKIAFELVTPTGAAIVGAHATSSSDWPSMVPERTGWGAGTADLPDRANLLRAVLGAEIAQIAPQPTGTHVVLEANIDDATGELLGACLSMLLAAGALDAWASPLTMKKGRPAHLLGALAPASLADEIATVILRESTSLGVRRHFVDRIERPRRIETVKTPFGPLPVKIAGGPYGPPQRKPELDACMAAAKAHGVPLRQVIDAAMVASAKLI